MKKKSEFGKISGTDLLNALYYLIGVFSLNVSALFATGITPSRQQYIQIIGAAASAGLLSVFKNIVRNSDGKYFKKEN